MIGPLTPRQLQVLELAAQGLTNSELCDRLGLQPQTVKVHKANIVDRLDARSFIHAVTVAYDTGLISPFQLGRRAA